MEIDPHEGCAANTVSTAVDFADTQSPLVVNSWPLLISYSVAKELLDVVLPFVVSQEATPPGPESLMTNGAP